VRTDAGLEPILARIGTDESTELMCAGFGNVFCQSLKHITLARKNLTNPKRERGRPSLTLRVGVRIFLAGVIISQRSFFSGNTSLRTSVVVV